MLFDSPTAAHIYDATGIRLTIRDLLNGADKSIWNKGMSIELRQLAQGNKYGVDFTDTMEYIYYNDIPKGEKSHMHNLYAIIVR